MKKGIIILTMIIIAGGLSLYLTDTFTKKEITENINADTVQIDKEENIIYGLNADDFNIETGYIQPDMFLSTFKGSGFQFWVRTFVAPVGGPPLDLRTLVSARPPYPGRCDPVSGL